MKFHELVAVLDREFSLYVRLSAADSNGYVKCITCGKMKRWNEVDNGHYIGRKHLATRFNEANCKPQCKWCNGHMEGQHFIFRSRLIELYGEEEIKKMEALAQVTKSENCESLRYKINECREKVKQLKIEKGLA